MYHGFGRIRECFDRHGTVSTSARAIQSGIISLPLRQQSAGIIGNYWSEKDGLRQDRIDGTVLDATTSNPIQGAQVTIAEMSKSILDVTDATGKFSFTELNIAEYTLIVTKKGYLHAEIGVTAKKDEDDRVITLQPIQSPLGNIIGYVQDRNNEPIEGALITLLDSDKTAISETNGKFSILDVEPGRQVSNTLRTVQVETSC